MIIIEVILNILCNKSKFKKINFVELIFKC